MNRLFRAISRYFMPDRRWDFEGRCQTCAKPLRLIANIGDGGTTVSLRAEPCEDHPLGGTVLWPQRRDVLLGFGMDDDDGPWSSCSPTPAWDESTPACEEQDYIADTADTIVCEVYPDNSVFRCCSEFSEQLEDPEEDGLDSGKRFIVDNQRIYDTGFKHAAGRIVECPFCHAEIRSVPRLGSSGVTGL